MIDSMATQPVNGSTSSQPTEVTPTPDAYAVDMRWPLAFLLVLVTILVYQPVWHAGFIWDDDVLITANRMVTASDGLYRFWFTTEAPDYYPLTSSLWWLEWRWWGNSPAQYHVANVLLHAINAVLVWIILRRLKVPGAWLAGLVFAIHPVNVATAAWISEQKNTLSMFFGALSVLLYLRFDEDDRWRWYSSSLAAFLLALLSKTAVVMLPIVLLGCVWWLHGTVRRKDFLRVGPFVVLSLVLGIVTIWFQHNRALVLGELSVPTGNVLSRVAVAGWALWFYFCKAILPWNLCAIYPKWNLDGPLWVAYLPGMLLVGCFALFWWKRESWGRPLLFGLGYFVLMLFPVLGFFRISLHEHTLVADHWQYHALAGVIALVVAAGTAVCRRWGLLGKYVGVSAGVAVLMVLGAATWTRACVYGGSETLWRDTVAKSPNDWVAHYNLGNALLQTGAFKDAIAQYEQAIQIEPDHQELHNNIAFALLQAGKVNDAVAHLEQVVRINPHSAEGHCNLGNAYLQMGSVTDAIGHFELALRLDPNFVQAHVNLGFALAQQGKFAEAERHWETAMRLDPGNQDGQRGLDRVRRIRSSRIPAP
jgi:protein O-mannosyl-transferase